MLHTFQHCCTSFWLLSHLFIKKKNTMKDTTIEEFHSKTHYRPLSRIFFFTYIDGSYKHTRHNREIKLCFPLTSAFIIFRLLEMYVQHFGMKFFHCSKVYNVLLFIAPPSGEVCNEAWCCWSSGLQTDTQLNQKRIHAALLFTIRSTFIHHHHLSSIM